MWTRRQTDCLNSTESLMSGENTLREGFVVGRSPTPEKDDGFSSSGKKIVLFQYR